METKQKTQKVLDIRENGLWLICIKHLTPDYNQYHLYKQWYDPGKGYKKKQIAAYNDFMSILNAIRAIYTSLKVMS